MAKKESMHIAEYLLSGFDGQYLSATFVSYIFSVIVILPAILLLATLFAHSQIVKGLPLFVSIGVLAEYTLCRRVSAKQQARRTLVASEPVAATSSAIAPGSLQKPKSDSPDQSKAANGEGTDTNSVPSGFMFTLETMTNASKNILIVALVCVVLKFMLPLPEDDHLRVSSVSIPEDLKRIGVTEQTVVEQLRAKLAHLAYESSNGELPKLNSYNEKREIELEVGEIKFNPESLRYLLYGERESVKIVITSDEHEIRLIMNGIQTTEASVEEIRSVPVPIFAHHAMTSASKEVPAPHNAKKPRPAISLSVPGFRSTIYGDDSEQDRPQADIRYRALDACLDEAARQIVAVMQPLWLISIDESKGKYDEALSMLPSRLNNPNRRIRSAAFTLWGVILDDQEKWSEAQQKFDEAIDLDSNNYAAIYDAGWSLYRESDNIPDKVEKFRKLDRACENFQRATRMKSHFFDPYLMWGNALLAKAQNTPDLPTAKDEYENAFRKYEKAIEISPGNSEALNNLGEAHRILANTLLKAKPGDSQAAAHRRQAEELYKDAVHLKPKYADAYDSWASLYEDEKDWIHAAEKYALAAKYEEDKDDRAAERKKWITALAHMYYGPVW